MRIFKAVFIANAREYIRDKTAMFWFLLFPLIFVFLFGWIFTGISESSYNIGIILHSDDQFSTSLLEELRSISSFNITVERGSGTEELEALRKGKRALVLELPDFSSVSTAAGAIEIPVYYDSSKQQSSRVLLSVFSEMFNEIEREIIGIPKIFLLKAETIHTEELTDFDYILPGILAMALMQLGLFGSLSFLSMRERKIIRGLGVTPVSRTSILLSEILLRLILALVQTTIILLVAKIVFDIKIVTNVFSVLFVVITGSLTFISLGYMLISFVRTTEGGNGLIQVVQFPMMFLGGLFFPIELMPDFIQPITRILPLTYLGDALRIVITGIPGSYGLMSNVLILTCWLIATLIITVKRWRWE